jgi:hypothetical protein
LISLPIEDALKWIHNHHEVPRASTDPDFVRNAPVVVTSDAHTYYIRKFESAHPEKIFYVVKAADFSQLLHRFNVGINSVTLDEFLSQHDHFALIADHPENDWMEQELRRRGGFIFEREQRDSESVRILLSR